MDERNFYNRVTNSRKDILGEFLSLLNNLNINYCVIEGVGLNAYCEPILTLDFDCVILKEKIEELKKVLKEKDFKLRSHPHTIEVSKKGSDLKIQIQKNGRYQEFIQNAKEKSVLGYKIMVASKEDLIKGKIWAYQDEKRNEIKRAKDLLDIKRLVNKYPSLKSLIPKELKKKIFEEVN